LVRTQDDPTRHALLDVSSGTKLGRLERVAGCARHTGWVRFGVSVANFAEYSDPRVVAGCARLAEDSGWDGLFVWDHVTFVKAWRVAVGDPWILLTAAALATDRICLGPLVTPLARRRPSKLARETVTLDRLSGGRLILGVGLGAPIDDEYATFGEPTDARVLAERLDEGLDVLNALWSGQVVHHRGKHYVADDVAFQPTPAQEPRIPIWVGCQWPHRAPLVRASRWDGVVPLFPGEAEELRDPTKSELRDLLTFIEQRRGTLHEFDIVVGGETNESPEQGARVAALGANGATWWLEWLTPRRGPLDEIRRRIELGPPGTA
jgi:alkanesulfonate monooxygenase SsuD/methylene tetrahydromethanopterin reductase-like flavin-dependent oxidoreductase (luciferase family)